MTEMRDMEEILWLLSSDCHWLLQTRASAMPFAVARQRGSAAVRQTRRRLRPLS
jgi:hypothetical protein